MASDSAQIARTNGDLVAAVVTAGREHLAAVGAWAAAHPDELAVAAAPLVAFAAASRGRHLSMAEAAVISQLAYWGGVLMLRGYRQWKAEPLTPPARLSRIG